MPRHGSIVRSRTVGLGLLAAVLLLGGGCSGRPDETKGYSEDGYMGMTNTNPSLPLSPTYHNYQADTDMMNGALGLVPGITDSRIMLNGSNATVNLSVPKGTSDEELARIEQAALVELSKAAPRYRYSVKVAR